MLSVIIPVGPGREENLKLALVGLSLQTYQDFETIIVANCQLPLMMPQAGRSLRAFEREYDPNEHGIHSKNRNMGVGASNGEPLIFIDSDVVLEKHALEYYAEGFTNFPNRAICGLYHWLPPMVVTPEDVAYRYDELLNGKLPPSGEPVVNNVGLDPRFKDFQAAIPDRLYCDYGRCLGMLTGNIGMSKACFNHVGGFWEDIDFCEDGAFGLAWCKAGFSTSFDKRIVGAHLHHPRSSNLQKGSEEAIEKIIQRFHQDQSWIGRMMKTVNDQ